MSQSNIGLRIDQGHDIIPIANDNTINSKQVIGTIQLEMYLKNDWNNKYYMKTKT